MWQKQGKTKNTQCVHTILPSENTEFSVAKLETLLHKNAASNFFVCFCPSISLRESHSIAKRYSRRQSGTGRLRCPLNRLSLKLCESDRTIKTNKLFTTAIWEQQKHNRIEGSVVGVRYKLLFAESTAGEGYIIITHIYKNKTRGQRVSLTKWNMQIILLASCVLSQNSSMDECFLFFKRVRFSKPRKHF